MNAGAIPTDIAHQLEQLPSLDTARGRTVHERVRNALRNAIVSGVFPPNSKLLQTEIARRLEVSVTPVREALRDLASEGLIRMDAHKGAVVTGITLEEFQDVHLLLNACSQVMAELLVLRATEEDIAALETVQQQIEENPNDYAKLNSRFHSLLSEATHSERVNSFIVSLNSTSQLILNAALNAVPRRLWEGIHEHRLIIEAIKRRDAAQISAHLIEHRRPTWEVVEGMLLKQSVESPVRKPAQAL
ncbi:GntR family transcriptional regulator [Microbacterium sp. NIBRBAC000506063]|uniref:GntR family transcriptional regulator n=1 Tax=Microbacterium sp. NIBRBAC000506063 TaxID=2734618 RepID=UPI001BB78F11|nr:GntR family transcriptional regulator [Microbacterium sp. NIBRBAC000506063]QTV80431.1 GntR family transcriptional regulator [Microbacterium sp. NIBRBAC000506063]